MLGSDMEKYQDIFDIAMRDLTDASEDVRNASAFAIGDY